jgi:hypothetical protein
VKCSEDEECMVEGERKKEEIKKQERVIVS